MLAKSSKEKKRLKRKAKQKQVQVARSRSSIRERAQLYAAEAAYFAESGDFQRAVTNIRKAVKLVPNDPDMFRHLGYVGSRLNDPGLELEAIQGLERLGVDSDGDKIHKLFILMALEKYKEGLECSKTLLANFKNFNIKSKRKVKKEIQEAGEYCQHYLARQTMQDVFAANTAFSRKKLEKTVKKAKSNKKKTAPQIKGGDISPSHLDQADPVSSRITVPEIPLSVTIDKDSFLNSLIDPTPVGLGLYDLALESHAIRFKESFETLVCLAALSQVRSYWYQEETAKKVLKHFRGRALLSDEVGLGKTIEALIILSEYIKRGMVKSALILTPTPLVSQWKDEMKSKFNLDIPSTDDADFKKKGAAFWDAPFILASINQAKSKKNFEKVTSREYDILIVDEAHHLKNRTTLNWKLVNAVQKRFILLLTATPVENNLMELYNLITLLKPGQLETATAFREKFMTKGDPTDPRNRALLKELLQEVMIRNTRALAGINIPPRYAQTIRIDASKGELAFYERLEALIMALNSSHKGRGRLITKNLLAQAGSSPKAVEGALTNMLEKKSYTDAHEKELRALKNLCKTTLDTPKNKALLKLVQSSREKIIVFVKYRGTLDHLCEFLEWHDIPLARFHGQMNNQKKDREIEAFQKDKQVLVTTEIGGEGRNLQFCCRMVNYDLPWNPMKIEQRIGRIHRIGQEKEVQIFNFCGVGSIEEYILDILDRKINMFEMVVGEIDMIIGRIRGEKEFDELVYDLWVDAQSPEERKKGFDALGTKMKRARTGYEKTRELDEKLFGDSYEL
jgi:SNF2 family DNA or RNA helicase